MANSALIPRRSHGQARRLAPDLARLPIVHNIRAFSVVEGVRAALAVAVLIAASEFLTQPLLRESALAALWTCLCDPGGPVGRRVPVLLNFTFFGALLTFVFGLARWFSPGAALLLGTLCVFAGSFAAVYGPAARQVGALLSMAVVLALDRGMPLPLAAETAGAFALGGLWASLLTLVLWRLYPYRATRLAVAEVYHALAAMCGDLSGLLRRESDSAAWETHARAQRRAVRDAVEAARDVVLGTLRGRGAGDLPVSRNLIRLETADQMFGALIALSDVLEHGTAADRAFGQRVLRRLRPLLRVLAGVALSNTEPSHPRIEQAIDALAADIVSLKPGEQLRAIANRIVERLHIARTLAVPANLVPGAETDGRPPRWSERLLGPARANLEWRSPALRHALRVAAMTGPALAFTMLWFTPYDHWLTITIIATMQPFFAPTYTRALERIGGTVLGGLVAAGVGLLCTTPMSIALAMFPLAVAALAVRSINFGLFMVALTPVVVLLVETGEPDTAEWRIALARAALTIIGGLLAVAASFVLWPSREPGRLATGTRTAIAAHGRYAEAEFASLLGERPVIGVEHARREAGVASNALETSINRALIERTSARDLLESALVTDAALRRYAGRLSAMHLDPGMKQAMNVTALREWRDWIGSSMRMLAAGKTALEPRPTSGASEAPRRLARQIELIAGAMGRLPDE